MFDDKPILAIETSDVVCGATIYFSDEKYFSSTTRLKNAHSEKIFESIDHLFGASGISPLELGAVAISEGPGSFTGLRIGMSAAKGLAHGASVPLVPVPTFEALAYQFSIILPENFQFIIANRVNREEVYFAKFQVKGNNYIFADDLKVLQNSDFIEKAKDCRVFGNATGVIGGAESEDLVYVSPDPVFVARWAARFGKEKMTKDYNFIEPNYLKEFLIKEKI